MQSTKVGVSVQIEVRPRQHVLQNSQCTAAKFVHPGLAREPLHCFKFGLFLFDLFIFGISSGVSFARLDSTLEDESGPPLGPCAIRGGSLEVL